MINALRSVLFNIYYIVWTLLMGVVYLPLLVVLPKRAFTSMVRIWLNGLIGGARVLVGIRWRIEGKENLPQGACIVVSKHQSAWETLFFHILLADPVYVLKKELLSIPLVGWYMRKTGMIAIDRNAGASALRGMLKQADAVLAENHQIVIFPEGTRVIPGDQKPWQPGVGALYGRFGDRIPVVPVALNSGLVWPRNSFVKTPGEVVVRVLPPMPVGLDKRAFVEQVRQTIETATDELCGITRD